MSTADSSNKTRRLVDVVRVLVAVVLGSIGAAAGFTHTHDWAVHHGQLGWIAWADAVVIEGIVIVAGFEIQRDHRIGGARKLTFPMVVLVAGFGVQMAAQVALAEPSPAGWLVAAMPALGFLVVVKLLMRRTPAPETREPVADLEPVTASASRTGVFIDPASAAVVTPVRPRLRLPAELTSRINTVAETARSEGRELTIEEIRRVVRVPEPMAVQILQDLATG
ncbi:hypothetical protein Amsp01_012680 [Amycolatopsis sp. NBRC 101858]|uniref:DUF2637 domain-containing protein n=1 Tax=Amycolatopsis sp. NBRC 101858 TaxID=3032200 RepID=UPI0024A5E34F|nr:DUF2637 domain-containing protein [Amycolatopsis sp. NBRC 101858]GLY35244.1 hypothetical protein Amsp01_012680 [Amycolatopsis sp. NBRC 101858]